MLLVDSVSHGGHTFKVCFDEPTVCPRCGHAIKPQSLNSTAYSDNSGALFLCKTYLCKHCYDAFLVLYQIEGFQHESGGGRNTRVLYIGPSTFSSRSFSASLEAVSPKFTKIYNQALAAETSGLDEIAGIGYRKALEFLVKDYLIHENPEDAETIKKMELGNCIANKVSNEKLKIAASRSAWIGNDMTHYEQRHADLNIEDLKKFIEASIYWVSMELATEDALGITKAGR